MTDAKTELREEFERQALWRDDKAEQYPADERNREAATLYRRLAASVWRCSADVAEAARELFDDEQDAETWLQMMGEIGFHYWPHTAEQFCRDFIARQTGAGS